MSLKNNDLEGRLREVMEHYELPYEPSGWKKLEKTLNRHHLKDYSGWVAVAATAAVLALGGYAYSRTFKEVRALAGYGTERMADTAPVAHIHSVWNLRSGKVPSDEAALHAGNALVTMDSPAGNSRLAAETLSVNYRASAAALPSGSPSDRPSPAVGQSAPMMLESSIRQACAGFPVDFSVRNGPTGGSYLWNFGDGNFSNQPRPTHRYEKPGVFDVSLSVTDESGRITTNVMNGMVTISPAPKADFEWDFVNHGGESPTLKILNTSAFAQNSEWQFADGTVASVANPVKALPEEGKFMIALEVKNEWGCTDSKVKYVHVNSDYNLLAPASFTPGKDAFMPEALRQGKMNFRLSVFDDDRVVFESTSKNKGWDGRLPDGTHAPAGSTYHWIVLVYNEATKDEKYFSGVVAVNP